MNGLEARRTGRAASVPRELFSPPGRALGGGASAAFLRRRPMAGTTRLPAGRTSGRATGNRQFSRGTLQSPAAHGGQGAPPGQNVPAMHPANPQQELSNATDPATFHWGRQKTSRYLPAQEAGRKSRKSLPGLRPQCVLLARAPGLALRQCVPRRGAVC